MKKQKTESIKKDVKFNVDNITFRDPLTQSTINLSEYNGLLDIDCDGNILPANQSDILKDYIFLREHDAINLKKAFANKLSRVSDNDVTNFADIHDFYDRLNGFSSLWVLDLYNGHFNITILEENENNNNTFSSYNYLKLTDNQNFFPLWCKSFYNANYIYAGNIQIRFNFKNDQYLYIEPNRLVMISDINKHDNFASIPYDILNYTNDKTNIDSISLNSFDTSSIIRSYLKDSEKMMKLFTGFKNVTYTSSLKNLLLNKNSIKIAYSPFIGGFVLCDETQYKDGYIYSDNPSEDIINNFFRNISGKLNCRLICSFQPKDDNLLFRPSIELYLEKKLPMYAALVECIYTTYENFAEEYNFIPRLPFDSYHFFCKSKIVVNYPFSKGEWNYCFSLMDLHVTSHHQTAHVFYPIYKCNFINSIWQELINENKTEVFIEEKLNICKNCNKHICMTCNKRKKL